MTSEEDKQKLRDLAKGAADEALAASGIDPSRKQLEIPIVVTCPACKVESAATVPHELVTGSLAMGAILQKLARIEKHMGIDDQPARRKYTSQELGGKSQ